MNLDNKVALVTGGASGLGQATVEKFVEKGAKTVILDINEDNANKIINNQALSFQLRAYSLFHFLFLDLTNSAIYFLVLYKRSF